MTHKSSLYPLRFQPIFKEKIWGGRDLKSVLNKPIPNGQIGESWEISAVENNASKVENGPLAGYNLQEVLERFKEKLVGKSTFRQYGNHFPLLVKFIDAHQTLSVQLHPDDELAARRHNSFGKTEMWHVIQTQDEAEIINGFKKGVTRQDYLENLEQGSIEKILYRENVEKGDSIFIKPGLIHSIGAGILLAEIQQTSDITYRVYDWKRPDKDGKPRKLHTRLALEAIDFEPLRNNKIPASLRKNHPTPIIKNKYFTTQHLYLQDKDFVWNYPEVDSFVILMCTRGKCEIQCDSHQEELNFGETLLIPAQFKKFTIKAMDSELLLISA